MWYEWPRESFSIKVFLWKCKRQLSSWNAVKTGGNPIAQTAHLLRVLLGYQPQRSPGHVSLKQKDINKPWKTFHQQLGAQESFGWSCWTVRIRLRIQPEVPQIRQKHTHKKKHHSEVIFVTWRKVKVKGHYTLNPTSNYETTCCFSMEWNCRCNWFAMCDFCNYGHGFSRHINHFAGYYQTADPALILEIWINFDEMSRPQWKWQSQYLISEEENPKSSLHNPCDLTSLSASESLVTKLSGKTPCLPPISPLHQPGSPVSWRQNAKHLNYQFVITV